MVGRESAGVPDAVHEAADARLVVPMRPPLRSLNVAVAAAMVMGEALRQTDGFPPGVIATRFDLLLSPRQNDLYQQHDHNPTLQPISNARKTTARAWFETLRDRICRPSSGWRTSFPPRCRRPDGAGPVRAPALATALIIGASRAAAASWR